ncbi:hypothetical protein RHMOL_Rhmol11G0152100 [Rhododendron molle]|uniref:Uncharacterized protein n=1 Tax=Rhododendron molle TaxID=49168 RepID=A0ACC0LTJ9_RHOML|nr:hypothetical protein RHMOL_Rhmol11G0152100 [Rhododendron molle]
MDGQIHTVDGHISNGDGERNRRMKRAKIVKNKVDCPELNFPSSRPAHKLCPLSRIRGEK